MQALLFLYMGYEESNMGVSIKLANDDHEDLYTFEEWVESPNILSIGALGAGELPVLSKSEWEQFKKCGDTVFELMEGGE